MEIQEIVKKQREYFESGATLPLQFRLQALRKLREAVKSNEQLLNDALMSDLHKHPMESYMCETGLVLEEISYHMKMLPRWIKDRRKPTPLAQFAAKSFQSAQPYGLTLVMSPWNYPVQLCLVPLVGALSAGNCAVVKPSAYAPACSAAIAKILGETYSNEYVAVVEGGRAQNTALLEQKFDYIFFTGSVEVGKLVMTAAAQHLTPVTLELGGKSPVIVDSTANIPLAARRIAFGKTLNAGQTCVQPDYLLIHKSVKERFVQEFTRALGEFFPGGDMSAMPHIVNEKHYQRVKGLMQGTQILAGGQTDDSQRFIAPTLLGGITEQSPVMLEEIFGPLLPVIEFESIDECVSFVRARPRPLAFYLFSQDAAVQKLLLDSCSFGGGCINDTIIHLATTEMPFGGVGESGMGSYHGEKSFETFSHFRSIVKKACWLDLPMRYHPYTEKKLALVKRFMK